MTIKKLRLATVLSLMLVGHGVVAQDLTPPPEGFRGTPFRGVAIGDSREAIASALSAIGLRCFTAEEEYLISPISRQTPGGSGSGKPIFPYDEEGSSAPVIEGPELEVGTSPERCRIVPAEFDINVGATGENYLSQILMSGNIPYFQIQFAEGRAAALYLWPSYFNAGSWTPEQFARSIVDAYDIPEGLQPNQFGWSGFTNKGEMITLRVSPNGRNFAMTVEMPTAKDKPTFN